eukprot:4841547-Amphidinium_carterae.5
MKRYLPTDSFLKLGVVNAIDGSKPQHKSYAHLFVDSFEDLDAFKQTFAKVTLKQIAVQLFLQ